MGRDDTCMVSKLNIGHKYRGLRIRTFRFQKEKRRSVVLGLGAGSFEYSVADPPTRRKEA